jgi:FkbM family methyltransferase
MLTSHLNKPWFRYQPTMVVKRLWRALDRSSQPRRRVYLRWGTHLNIDKAETIGHAIWTTGIFDIATSEVLWRLTQPGDVCVDVGANIGYMTSIMARRAAPAGRVYAFEPQPKVNLELEKNVQGFPQGWAQVFPSNAAVSNQTGNALLWESLNFDHNHGTAALGTEPEASGRSTLVNTHRLDDQFDSCINVLKIDVEGHEARVLEGAERLLSQGLIQNIVFEDHHCGSGELASMLKGFGFDVVGIDWNADGPLLISDTRLTARKFNESPNFLATKSPSEVCARLKLRGWEIFAG